ncbi:hypothetical protein [Mangrovimonas sp. TPBH4]|uniref:hypothetical protein n=1 Tax=Mangrovimonas sp. TPBH4 TaxID=1645914 RepID=UPI0006B45BE3|nr:hypothetical protein [Mangrovimonas sp. TPBH4]
MRNNCPRKRRIRASVVDATLDGINQAFREDPLMTGFLVYYKFQKTDIPKLGKLTINLFKESF